MEKSTKNTNQVQNPMKPGFLESSGPILSETEEKSGSSDFARMVLKWDCQLSYSLLSPGDNPHLAHLAVVARSFGSLGFIN